MKISELQKKIQAEITKAKNTEQNAEGLVRLQEAMQAYSGEDKLVWSDDLLEEIKKRPVTKGYEMGMNKLDTLIGGFRPQQLVTISGHSKHGKTGWAMFSMEKLEETNPVMIPLEQSNEELIMQRHENGQSIPRFLSPRKLASRVTLDWIEERIIEGIAKHNTKLVVIDHLGYIDNDSQHKENLAYRIEMTMKGLKNLAKKWNVAILVLVHISQHDESHPPTLQDLKGSSSILQESDLVIMLWRKNRLENKVRLYDDKTMVSVLANRRTGKTGSVGLRFESSTGRYHVEHEWVENLINEAERNDIDDF